MVKTDAAGLGEARSGLVDNNSDNSGKAPHWLLAVVELIEREAEKIEPINDDRDQLPEFVYRH